MSQSTLNETPRRERRSYRPGYGCGCAFPPVVLVLGIALALFGLNIGLGLSARVPFTESNLTLAGSVGDKDIAKETLPDYVAGRVGESNNFVNQSITLTIWRAEGISVIVLGKQEGAPTIDLHLELTRR